MAGWISQTSPFTVFLGIAGFGFLFLLVSLVFGEIFEHLGSWDHDFDHGGPSIFSPRVISVFVTGFGGCGALAVHYGYSTPVASGAGFLSGIALASLIYLFARFLYGQQATTQVASTDMLGRQARVVVAIPKGGVGQVRCQVGEEMIDKVARSQSGEAVAENSIVEVTQVLGDVVIVK